MSVWTSFLKMTKICKNQEPVAPETNHRKVNLSI